MNYIKKLKSIHLILITLFFFSCAGDSKSTNKESIENPIIPSGESTNLPIKGLDVCACNKKAQKIIDEMISIRSNFNSISDLKQDKGTVKKVRSKAAGYQSLIAECFKKNAVNLFEESECNDLKTLEEKKDLLFSLGIQIEQGANIRL